MSGARHIGLERAETVMHGPGARRRAALDEELRTALADGDAELVSRLRERLAGVEVGE
jgi:hypothetical protein